VIRSNPLPPPDTCAIVLAGGAGVRVQHLYPDLPKPLIPVGGRPFLEWVCRFWVRLGIRHFVISLGYKAEVAERQIAGWNWPGIEITCVKEETPLGTGGAVRFATASVPDAAPLVVINGDSLALGPIAQVWPRWRAADSAAIVIAVAVEDASRYGTLRIAPGGRLLSFEEKRPGRGWVSSGTYLLSKQTLSCFPPKSPLSMEYDVFPRLAEESKLHAFCMNGDFLDIGTPESLEKAESFIHHHKHDLELPG
jgi:D-glycero-alpha-D-manno-heptose 1-phosphate guanylyltransferase